MEPTENTGTHPFELLGELINSGDIKVVQFPNRVGDAQVNTLTEKQKEKRRNEVLNSMYRLIEFFPQVKALGLSLTSQMLTAHLWSLHPNGECEAFIHTAKELNLQWLELIGKDAITYYVLAPLDSGPFQTNTEDDYRVSMEWWGKRNERLVYENDGSSWNKFRLFTQLYEEVLMGQLLYSLHGVDLTFEDVEAYAESLSTKGECDKDE